MSGALKTPKDIQEKILARIDEDRLVKLCSSLIQIDSMVENEAAEVGMADFVGKYFTNLGMEVKVTDLPENIPNIPAGPHPQVVARKKGKGGPVLLTGGHMDVEPIVTPELWKHHPLSGDVADGYIYGVGTVNMKQSIASFMEAIKAIVDSGVEFGGDLLFMGTSQENAGLIGSKYATTNWEKVGLGPKPDMFFNGEQTDNSVWSTNTGWGFFIITTYGQCGHTSSQLTMHPSYDGLRQVNALQKMVKIINEIHQVKKNFVYERGHFLGDPFVTLGKISTTYPGTGSRVALGVDSCTLYVDIRFPPGMNKESCKRDIERIIYNLAVEDPNLKATVEVIKDPLGIETDEAVLPHPDLPLLKALKAAHKQVSGEDLIVDHETNGTSIHRVVDWCRYAGSDLMSWARVGVPGINYGAGIVPVTPDERVSIKDLVTHCKASALAMIEVLGAK